MGPQILTQWMNAIAARVKKPPAISSSAIGLLSGTTAVLPLLGRPLGFPSSVVAWLLAILLVVGAREHFARGNCQTAVSCILWLSIAFAGFVFMASPVEQWDFLLSKEMWGRRAEMYAESKLLMFIVSFVPPFVSAVVVAMIKEKDEVIAGVLNAIIATGVIAALFVIVFHGKDLFRTTHDVARGYFVSGQPSYSTVSYGILFATAAISAFVYQPWWVLAGFFLFMTAWLSRRAETILIVLAIQTFALVVAQMRLKKRVFREAGLALLLGGLLFAVAHNEHNIAYFKNIEIGAEHRWEMIAEVEGVTGSFGSVENLIGHGLGSYSHLTGGQKKYPHNIFIEAKYELGIFAAIIIVIIAMFPMVWGAHQLLLFKRGSLSTISLLGIVGVTFASALKAGDISNFGRLAFFSVLATQGLHQLKRHEAQQQSKVGPQ